MLENIFISSKIQKLEEENENLKKDVEFLKRLSLFEITEDYSQLKEENKNLKAENETLLQELATANDLNEELQDHESLWLRVKLMEQENQHLKAQLQSCDKASRVDVQAERKPHKCPVCDGKKKVKDYFPAIQLCNTCVSKYVAFQSKLKNIYTSPAAHIFKCDYCSDCKKACEQVKWEKDCDICNGTGIVWDK